MLSKQGIFNCDEITIGLLRGVTSDMHGILYIQCVCTDELATRVKSANEGYSSRSVCMYVCPFCLFCLLALLGVQGEVSAATPRKKAVKLKSRFLYNCLIQKLGAL